MQSNYILQVFPIQQTKQTKMSNLQENIKQISNLYRNLKKFQQPQEQTILLNRLEKLCRQTFQLLDKSLPTPENNRRIKQVKDIQNKVAELKEMQPVKVEKISGPTNPQKHNNNQKLSKQELSRRIARTIAFEELRSTQLKVSPEQVEFVAKKMEGNLEIMKQIQNMVVEQGENLDLIESNIMGVYEDTKQANKQLDKAAAIQNKTRMMKIRAGMVGILGTIGMGIIGIPGMVVGMFAGWKIFK